MRMITKIVLFQSVYLQLYSREPHYGTRHPHIRYVNKSRAMLPSSGDLACSWSPHSIRIATRVTLRVPAC